MSKPIKLLADKCVGCQSCALVCSMFKAGVMRPKAAGIVVHLDQMKKEEKPVYCQQCKKPKCIEACPTGSLKQDASGVVLLDETKCTGCWSCVDACPFKAMHHDPIRQVAVKCDLCHGYEAGPRCVTICPVQALTLAAE